MSDQDPAILFDELTDEVTEEGDADCGEVPSDLLKIYVAIEQEGITEEEFHEAFAAKAVRAEGAKKAKAGKAAKKR